MKVLFAIVSFSLVVLFSCSDDPTKITNKQELIPRDKFVDILVDVHTMDAITNLPQYYRKFGAEDSVSVYGDIWKKYGVTRAEFDSTAAAYTRRPDLYLKIYDDVILKLNLKLDKLRDNEPSFSREKENKENGNPEK